MSNSGMEGTFGLIVPKDKADEFLKSVGSEIPSNEFNFNYAVAEKRRRLPLILRRAICFIFGHTLPKYSDNIKGYHCKIVGIEASAGKQELLISGNITIRCERCGREFRK